MGGSQKYIGIGIQAGVSVAFYLGIGLLLDTWLSTFPWLTLAGILVGIAGMTALFIRMYRDLNAQSKWEAKQKKAAKEKDHS
jgi:F0F1-type ATP synthase assembly protein I